MLKNGENMQKCKIRLAFLFAMRLLDSYKISGDRMKRILRDILSDSISRDLYEKPKQ